MPSFRSGNTGSGVPAFWLLVGISLWLPTVSCRDHGRLKLPVNELVRKFSVVDLVAFLVPRFRNEPTKGLEHQSAELLGRAVPKLKASKDRGPSEDPCLDDVCCMSAVILSGVPDELHLSQLKSRFQNQDGPLGHEGPGPKWNLIWALTWNDEA